MRPRRAVIDHAWRAIGPGVEVLSADDGGPLTRTVKRIIDPLVLRLRSNTRFSDPFVSAEVAVQMHDVIVGQTATLRATAQWFDLLKRERRRLRITTGNAQELYFPVCYELALLEGPPAQQDRTAAEHHLRAIHADRDRTAIEVLNRYLDDEAAVATLSAQLARSWQDVRAGTEMTGPFLAGLTTALGPADGHNAAAARQRVWSALVADATPYNLGAAAHHDGSGLPWSIVARIANLATKPASGGKPAISTTHARNDAPRKASATGTGRPMRAASSSSRLTPGTCPCSPATSGGGSVVPSSSVAPVPFSRARSTRSARRKRIATPRLDATR